MFNNSKRPGKPLASGALYQECCCKNPPGRILRIKKCLKVSHPVWTTVSSPSGTSPELEAAGKGENTLELYHGGWVRQPHAVLGERRGPWCGEKAAVLGHRGSQRAASERAASGAGAGLRLASQGCAKTSAGAKTNYLQPGGCFLLSTRWLPALQRLRASTPGSCC